MAQRESRSRRAGSGAKPRYSPHPGLGMEAKAAAKLHAGTGKSFERWVTLARRRRGDSVTALRTRLSNEHGVGSRVAWWIASAALAGLRHALGGRRGAEDVEVRRPHVEHLHPRDAA